MIKKQLDSALKKQTNKKLIKKTLTNERVLLKVLESLE